MISDVPRIVRTVFRVDDETIVKTNEAVSHLSRIGTAFFQRRQQSSAMQTSKNL